MRELPPPGQPQPDLRAYLWQRVLHLDAIDPPGDPGAVYCGMCGRGRRYAVPHRALVCAVCDTPTVR